MVALNVVIKDILNRILDMDDRYMPIGTIITSVDANFDPNDAYSGQTWEKISQGRFLMGADDSHAAGTTVAAGLPNITGYARPATRSGGYPLMVDEATGAFYKNNQQGYNAGNATLNTDTRYIGTHILLDASRSSSIYGNSTTVQPPAYCVHFWKRIA